jgi:hypothetical protein
MTTKGERLLPPGFRGALSSLLVVAEARRLRAQMMATPKAVYLRPALEVRLLTNFASLGLAAVSQLLYCLCSACQDVSLLHILKGEYLR